MKRILKTAVLLIACLTALCGCRQNSVDRDLDVAEAIMEERPDSAMALLSDIVGPELRGERRARHALLVSQAYHKNYNDITDDGLISIAVDYYARTDDDHHKMLAYYYRAVVNRNAGYYAEAMADLLRAYDIAGALDDPLNLSRIESLMARLYNATHNFEESLLWEQRALVHAKMAGKTQWVLNGYGNMGDGLFSLQRFDDALCYADSAEALSGAPDADIFRLRYMSHFFLGHYDLSDSLYQEILRAGFELPDVVLVAQCELHPDNAFDLLAQAERYSDPDELYKHDLNYAYAKAYLRSGDIKSALPYLDKHVDTYNNMVSTLVDNSLDKVCIEHDRRKMAELREQTRRSRLMLWCALAVAMLLAAVAAVIFRHVRNVHKTRLLQKERDLALLDRDFSAMRSELLSAEKKMSESRGRIAALQGDIERLNNRLDRIRYESYIAFVRQFSWIGKLGTLLTDANSDPACREKMLYKAVENELKSSEPTLFLRKLQEIIKEQNPEMAVELEKLQLIESEQTVLIYGLCGLSTRVIAMLTRRSERAIYNLRSRIKAKLAKSDSQFARQIIETL